MPEAVPEFIWFAVLIFSFAVVYTLRKFIDAMFGTLISILESLHLGGVFGGLLRSVEQAVSGALGTAEGAIDSAIGASFHELARMMDWLWREFKAHGALLALLASPLAGLVIAYEAFKHAIRDLSHARGSISARLKTFEREFNGFEHGVRHFERDITKGINDTIKPEIKALDREIAKINSQVIPDIRSTAQGAEADVTALTKWITANVPLIGTTALVGAVAWALSALGLGGLRCSNFTNLLSKWKCGLGKLLDDLLGLVVAGLVLEAVCEFLPLVEDAFGAVVGPATHLLNEVPLGACEIPPKSWAKLAVAAGPLPPPQTLSGLTT